MSIQILGNTDYADLVQEVWDNNLRRQSVPADIFGELVGLYSEELRMLPNSLIMRLPFKKGVYRHTIVLLMALAGAGVNGRTDQVDQEEAQVLKYFTAYSNDYSHAVSTRKYGIDAHVNEGLGLMKWINQQLGDWHKEKFGRKCRQALLQRVDEDLVVAPTSRTQHWNKNMLMKNVSLVYSAGNQPTYDSTLATMTESLGDAIETAGASAAWDTKYFAAIRHFATNMWEIEPYTANRYALTVPGFQSLGLKDLTTSGSLAYFQKDSFVKEIAPNAWQYYIGSLPIYGLDLWEDPRSPVLQRTGSDGSWAVAAYYRGMGSTDDRPTSGTLVDCGFLMGKSPIVVAEHEKLHYEEEIRSYGKRAGIGAFRGCGAQALEFDTGNPGDTTRRNQNSAVILARRTSATA